MKSRILWLIVVLAALGGFYYTTIRPTLAPAPASLNRRINREFRPQDIPPPPLPQPKIEMPAIPLPTPAIAPFPNSTTPAPRDNRRPTQVEVPIQDGATIDFSVGAPHIRVQGEDKAALDKALKEMTEATKDVAFPPAGAPQKN